MGKLDLTKFKVKNGKTWMAVDPRSNRIVGQAESLESVLTVAKKVKVSNPTVFKIGPFASAFVGYV